VDCGRVAVLLVSALGWSLFDDSSKGTPFPGLMAFTSVGVTERVYSSVPFFGIDLPVYSVTLVLYLSLAVWVIIAILQNLKKDRADVRLISNLKALGFAIYANVLLIGFLSPSYVSQLTRAFAIENAAIAFLLLNMALIYAVGLATLAPAERLKTWYRRFQTRNIAMFSNDALPVLWLLLTAAVSYTTYLYITNNSSEIAPAEAWNIGRVAFGLALILAFAVRDVLFLQLCLVSRMKNAFAKGAGLIILYYVAVFIASHWWTSPAVRVLPLELRAFTPASAFETYAIGAPELIALSLQALIILWFLILIIRRLSATPGIPAAARPEPQPSPA
jgi:hypothetical protein